MDTPENCATGVDCLNARAFSSACWVSLGVSVIVSVWKEYKFSMS